VIQCKEISTPQKSNLIRSLLETFMLILKITAISIKKIKAISILYQTKPRDSIEIKEPNIAVNPKMKTMK